MSDTSVYTFVVTGMHCGSCGVLIDDRLADLPGVTDAHTTVSAGRTTVHVNPDLTSPAQIIHAIAEVGYTAVLAPRASVTAPPGPAPLLAAPKPSTATHTVPRRSWPQRIGRGILRAGPWLSLLPLAVAVWFVLAFDPTNGKIGPEGPCAWHAVTGINGPTCGGTRMFYYLIHGDVINAARNHLPALIAVPFLAYWWVRWMLKTTLGVSIPRLRINTFVVICYGVFFLVFSTVLRNLDIGPLAWFNIPSATAKMI